MVQRNTLVTLHGSAAASCLLWIGTIQSGAGSMTSVASFASPLELGVRSRGVA